MVKWALLFLCHLEVCSKASPESWGVAVPACIISVCDPCNIDTRSVALESRV